MKLSFSLTSSKPPKPSLKPSQNQPSPSSSPPNKQFVTEFDASKTPLTNPNSKTPNIIAPIANNWRPHKKPRNIDLPDKSEDPNLQFEVVNSTIEPIDPNISYGLNLRSKKNPNPNPNSKSEPEPEPARFQSIDALMLNKLRSDLDNLPEDRGFDEFSDMPVEDFATALLKGYGWHEGKGVGKNAKEDVKVFEFKQRTGKEGLGFVNDVPVPLSHEQDRPRKINKEKAVNDKKTSSKRGRERERERERLETSAATRTKSTKSTKSWLASRIRVRVISKELKGGRLYLQKGEIVDVVGPTSCDVSMDNSRELVQGVDQEFLETALPRRGGPVLVLCGRYKGVYGSLQEKDVDNETAVVRDADTHALLNVRLEQVAEFVGDPDDIGY